MIALIYGTIRVPYGRWIKLTFTACHEMWIYGAFSNCKPCMSHVLHRASINCGNKIECKVIRVDVDVCTKTFN
jgi:hypothetical protein